MIKFLIAFAPPHGMPRDAALTHYRDRHGPLVASVPEFRAETRAYLQNEVIGTDAPASADAPYIGVSELWFDDWQRYDAAFSNSSYLAQIRPDESRFADLSSALVAFAQDNILFGGGHVPSFKLFRFWEVSSDLSADEFRTRWKAYGSAIAADDTVRALATAYVQNEGVSPLDNPFPLARTFTGIDEYWLRDPEQAQSLLRRSSAHARAHGIDTCCCDSQLGSIVARTRAIPGFT